MKQIPYQDLVEHRRYNAKVISYDELNKSPMRLIPNLKYAPSTLIV
jgi:hypothetical protein